MSQKETRRLPTRPGVGRGRVQTKPERKRGRVRGTRRDLWAETSWSSPLWSRMTPGHRGSRARSLTRDRGSASPQNAARERSRVRTLRQAFLALQAALPAVPPDTKLSKLDVLVLATSYIAHLTRTLSSDAPGPAWPPRLWGLNYLHPLKKWPMRSRLYAGGLGCSSLDPSMAATSSQKNNEAEDRSLVSGEASVLLPARLPSPAHADEFTHKALLLTSLLLERRTADPVEALAKSLPLGVSLLPPMDSVLPCRGFREGAHDRGCEDVDKVLRARCSQGS